MPWRNARPTSGISNANEANSDVNCFEESSIPSSDGRPSGWQSGRPTAVVRLTLLLLAFTWPLPTLGQGWDSAFSDYLLTGQEPRPAVARVVAPDGSGTSLGSGVLVDSNASQALVLTNWHVVRDSRSAVLVQFPDGFQSAGTVLRVDAVWDLAAIVIWKPNVEPVSLAAQAPLIGEPLTIAGYGRGPYREESGGCTQYLSPGSGQPMELVELVAEARQGDSGGPIFNARGELAGVLFGESGGRTIGASSPRVRAFLASVGSTGYMAPAANALAASSAPATPSPMLPASHRPAPESPATTRPLTLTMPPQQPSENAPPERVQTPAQPASLRAEPAESGGVAPEAEAAAALPPTSTALKPPQPLAAAPSDESGRLAPSPPPPLEFNDLVAAVRSLAPSGNPSSLLVGVGAGALVLFGLRGITRSVS